MGRITSISSQVKRAGRINVFIDEKYAFSLSVTELADAGLKTGDELSPADLKKFAKTSASGKLKERVTKWALLRPHSKKEINDYLRRVQPEDSEAQKNLFEYLDKIGFVDDRAFAESFIRLRRERGYSRYVLSRELKTKGIDGDLIDELLSDDDSDRQALNLLIEKKRSKYPDKRKLMAYLASKGYRYDQIKEALELN